LAAKSPEEIVNASAKAISQATAVHVAGSVANGGSPVSLDLSLVSGRGGRGAVSANGLTFRIIAVGNSVYIQADPPVWERLVGAARARRVEGKWLQAPATGEFSSVAALTNLRRLYGTVLPGHGSLKKGAVSTVNGQKAVAVTSTKTGETVYVATTGPPYPIAIVGSGPTGGRIVFDHVNQPVTLTPPANPVSLSQLG
jgi:hypothetical protein